MKSVAIWKGKADYLWIFQKAVLCHCLRVGEKGSSGRCVGHACCLLAYKQSQLVIFFSSFSGKSGGKIKRKENLLAQMKPD